MPCGSKKKVQIGSQRLPFEWTITAYIHAYMHT